MTTAIRCETCRWNQGGCYRFPSSKDTLSLIDGSHMSRSTIVHDDDWCGEWQHDPRRFKVIPRLMDREGRMDGAGLVPVGEGIHAPEPILWPWEVEA